MLSCVWGFAKVWIWLIGKKKLRTPMFRIKKGFRITKPRVNGGLSENKRGMEGSVKRIWASNLERRRASQDIVIKESRSRHNRSCNY